MPTTITWPLSTGPVGEVAIANQALGLIGANYLTATSLPDSSGTPEANYINQWYAPLRNAVLEDRDWTFAVTKVLLTPVGSPGTGGTPVLPPMWGFEYQLPSDCLRVVKLFNPIVSTGSPNLSGDTDDFEAPEIPVQFEVLKRYAFCNESSVWMKYVQQITDTTQFSPNFVVALAARIAMELALPLTNNVQLFQAMSQKYQLALKDAAAGDGRQGTSQKIKSSPRLHLSRYGRR